MSNKMLSIVAAALILIGAGPAVVALGVAAGPLVAVAVSTFAVGVLCAVVVMLRSEAEQLRIQRSLRDVSVREGRKLEELRALVERRLQDCGHTEDGALADELARSEERIREHVDRAHEELTHHVDARILGLYETMWRDGRAKEQ